MNEEHVVVGIADHQPELQDQLRRTRPPIAAVPPLAIKEAVAS